MAKIAEKIALVHDRVNTLFIDDSFNKLQHYITCICASLLWHTICEFFLIRSSKLYQSLLCQSQIENCNLVCLALDYYITIHVTSPKLTSLLLLQLPII